MWLEILTQLKLLLETHIILERSAVLPFDSVIATVLYLAVLSVVN